MKEILKVGMMGDIDDISESDAPKRNALIKAYRRYGNVAAQAANNMDGLDQEIVKEAWAEGGAHSAAAAAVAHVLLPRINSKLEEAMVNSVVPTCIALNQLGVYQPNAIALSISHGIAQYVIEDFTRWGHFPVEVAVSRADRGYWESVGSAITVMKQDCVGCGAEYAAHTHQLLAHSLADTAASLNLPTGWTMGIIRSLQDETVRGIAGRYEAREIDPNPIREAMGLGSRGLRPGDIAYYLAWYQALNTHIVGLHQTDSWRMSTWPRKRHIRKKQVISIGQAA
ncbi:hypothetical protein DND132_3148 [Pseudodesulfovibrio mercurii]|uniref:Uncharacterized protein n=1 Tax=Pseudodesulfovibrio mercurii TaxID=641491 RepID=F0JKA2_9BACT|nr:hypothetical protein [Pseudodesulfovibrio mercurii]EGB16351.1 hypothetical protein DND132_3148 [Pseudodesulfovibrio mercurii]